MFERRVRENVGVAEESFIMAVKIPEDMLMCGSPRYRRMAIDLVIKKETIFYPFEVFAAAIAHELSHIVRYSINSTLKNSEVATDLLAMIFGFKKIMGFCRENHRTMFGYLSPMQFYIAYSAILHELGG